MTDDRPRAEDDGPPTGADMASLVGEVKATVLARIGDGAIRRRRASRRHPQRNAYLGLAGIAVAVVLVVVAGSNLLGVGTWHRGDGGTASTGSETLTPTPTSSSTIDEATAIAIARANGNADLSAAAEAHLMTYLAWATQYDTGISTEINPLQSVWVVSVDGPTTFPGQGSPLSTIPPSEGFTVTINADSGSVIEFGAHPTAFSAGTSTLAGTPPVRPGQTIIPEQTAVAVALGGYGSPPDSPHSQQLITYADWPARFGGSAISTADQTRAAWVVGVDAAPAFPDLGPPGHTTIAATSYSVLLDGYTGQVVEFVAVDVFPG